MDENMTFELAHQRAEDWKKHAAALAEKHVRQLAREVLKKNPKLEEFVKGMGTSFFTFNSGLGVQHLNDSAEWLVRREVLVDIEPYKTLQDFLFKYDITYGITGIPVRFTTHGEERTDW